MVSKLAGAIASSGQLELPPPLKRKHHNVDLQPELNARSPCTEKPCEVTALPLLSVLNKNTQPIMEIWRIWTEGCDGCPRGLKSTLEQPSLSKNIYPKEGRNLVEIGKKLRVIAIVVELMLLDGKSNAVDLLEKHMKSEELSLNKFFELVSKEFSKHKLTSKGIRMNSSCIFSSPRYEMSDPFWKSL